jgi:hypothetical protein
MPVAQKINESAQAVLTAAGYGLARLGPGRAGLTWHVSSAAVRIVGATSVPEVHLYLGEPSPGNELTNSYSGANNSTDLDVILASGQYLTAEWIGGDPGARATLSIYGERV